MRLLLLLCIFCAAPAGAEIYTWKQGGAVHYTNQPDTIPLRYRSKAKVLAIPGESKQGAATQGQAQGAPSPSALPMPPPPPAAVIPQNSAKPADATRTERRSKRSLEED